MVVAAAPAVVEGLELLPQADATKAPATTRVVMAAARRAVLEIDDWEANMTSSWELGPTPGDGGAIATTTGPELSVCCC